jgi:hypothetical protein
MRLLYIKCDFKEYKQEGHSGIQIGDYGEALFMLHKA